MAIKAQYLGMPLDVSELDTENLEYFRFCAAHDFRLQACTGCGLLRYPPTTACPWCANPDSRWMPVEGRGTVHSYTEVHHAIQPAFRDHVPYLVVRKVGIGTRLRMVFSDIAPGLALPQWTLDEAAPQPATVWRYPE